LDRNPGWKARGEVNLWRLPGAKQTADVNQPAPKPKQAILPKPQAEAKTAEQIEKRAAGKLPLAKLLLQKRPEIARQNLRKVVSSFPGTKAAEEATALLTVKLWNLASETEIATLTP